MRRLFADTSYFIAVVNGADDYHAAVIQQSRCGPAEFTTHDLIIVELANELSDPRNRRAFLDLYDALRRDSRSVIVPVDSKLMEHAIDLYRHRLDKAWSLTDCASFLVMKDGRLRDALSTDRHFEQAGYRALLRDE